MTDDSIEAKALALVNEVRRERGGNSYTEYTRLRRDHDDAHEALCRAIEQHEAFKQEVSDALVIYSPENRNPALGRFIIPKPKPDPFEQTLKIMDAVMERLEAFRAALEARGLEIREKNDE